MTTYDRTHRQLRLSVLASANYRCHYCGGPATEADHVVELANGGQNVAANYVAACKSCNARRGGSLGGKRRAQKRLRTSRRW